MSMLNDDTALRLQYPRRAALSLEKSVKTYARGDTILENAPLLKLNNINISFLGTHVLHDVSFSIKPGEVCGLIGPNGSGKSTIAKILSGALQQASGEIFFSGKPLDNSSPAAVLEKGVFTLYQEQNLLPHLSIADNIFLGSYEKRAGFIVNQREINKQAKKALGYFGSGLSPKTKVGNLTKAERYIVSVARAFTRKAKLYILDEPTASLSHAERKVVLNLIKDLKRSQSSVLYITHRIDELRDVCDKLLIMRDGRILVSTDLAQIEDGKIFSLMRVSKKDLESEKNALVKGDVILEVSHLCLRKAYDDISLQLRKGEIIGIIGTSGSGRTALLKTLFGAARQDSGNIIFMGKKLINHSIHNAIMNGFGYLPDERLGSGIIPNLTMLDNVMLPQRKKERGFIIHHKHELETFIECIAEKGFSLLDPCKPIMYMSGGNQQKSLFFRWIVSRSTLLLLDEPTKGIDVGSKNEMYSIILDRAQQGVSFIICSSDLKELTPVCTRILTLKNRRLSGTLEANVDYE